MCFAGKILKSLERDHKEGKSMKKKIQGMLGGALLLSGATPAYANAPGGGYEGITAMYYVLIGVILAYGAYDIFFKKE